MRKDLTNEIITDLKALKHSNGTDLLFASVQKFYLDFPTSVPACMLISAGPSVNVDGIDYDSRVLAYDIIVYDQIETNSSYTEAERKLDRLSDIEDEVLDYLEKIPNPVEHAVANIHAYKLEVAPSNYDFESSEQGLRVYLTIPFSLYITITTKLL